MYGNILVIAIHIFVTIAFFLFPAMWVHGVCPMGMGNKYKGNRLCISCSFVPESLCSLTSNFLSFYSCTKDQVGLHQEVRQVQQFAQYSLSWGERWALRCYTTRYGEHADSRFCLGSLCMLGSSSRTENHCFQWPHLCASVQVPVPGGVGASALYSCTFVQQGQKFLGETQSSPSGIFGRLLGITLASSGTRLHGFCVIQYQAINYFCNIFC